MKWKRTKMAIKKGDQPSTVYFSKCGRYAVARRKEGYRLREREGGTETMFWVRNDTPLFAKLVEAKVAADEHEQVRLAIWRHFEARGKERHDGDKALLADNAKMEKCCVLVQDEARQRADWTVEHYVNHSYAYAKHRAHLTVGPDSFCWSKYADPAARREWFTMVEGECPVGREYKSA